MTTDNKDLSARWEWVLERAAKDLGISVGELKRRLVPPKLRTSEVERARARGAPNWVIDAIKNCPTDMMRDIALRDNRAPTGPSSQGIIPTSQPVSNVRGSGGGSGWAREIPLRNGLGQGRWAENAAFVPERKAKGE